ncbi:hypothetical protein HC341_12330 [Aquisalimonas sp. 2447]|uniref:hypothetical protein n=1 Tax=Aquisalimonas sp. 2447 TaxID=2740807 RepID=UPI0014324E35|nr:hypothetical protein [Aquisalimonas sp. 2447]QIT55920.1 hypothetical protein HC341_12330 [Aquisalimonas sp. 2447]
MDDSNNDPNNGRNYPSRQDADFPERYTADDEISLYDLWNVLERRWYVIVGVFLVVVGLALVYALNQEATYQFRTGLEIGTLGSADSLVETPNETRNRLRESIIPAARAELSGEMESVPRISIGGGEESSLIVLSTEGATERADDIEELHTQVSERLQEAHRRVADSRLNRLQLEKEGLEDELEYLTDERVVASRREDLQQRIASAEERISELEEEREETRESLEAGRRERERRLEALAEEREVAASELERLDQRGEILQRRIEATEELLADLRRNRTQLMSNGGSDPTMALFLGTTELDHVQGRLDGLEDQYNFELPRQRDELRTDLEDIRRDREGIQDELTELRIELENLESRFERRIASQQRTISEQETALARLEADLQQERRGKERDIRDIDAQMDDIVVTSANFVSVRSVEQTGTGRSLILALAIVLGGMLGLFSAFFWEFVTNARRYRRQS